MCKKLKIKSAIDVSEEEEQSFLQQESGSLHSVNDPDYWEFQGTLWIFTTGTEVIQNRCQQTSHMSLISSAHIDVT